MSNSRPIAFTGGGTGGHVYPAKPIMDALRENAGSSDPAFYWIGSKTGVEREIVASWDIPYFGISSGKLRRYFSWQNVTDVFRIIAGFFQARRILKRDRPAFLFSKGGFVSVPPVVAARTLGIPVYTHESDVTPALGTRINSRFVNKIFIPYEETLPYMKPGLRPKCVVSGNPVRGEFFSGNRDKGRAWADVQGNLPLLLVLGGSQGAEQINRLIEENLEELTRFCHIVHQTGPKNYTPLQHVNYTRIAYLKEEIYDVMAAADGALTRCGANSLWELAASKTPLLMLPLRVGSRGDQVYNAELFQKAGAGIVLDEKDMGGRSIVEHVKNLLLGNGGDTVLKDLSISLKIGRAPRIILDSIREDLP